MRKLFGWVAEAAVAAAKGAVWLVAQGVLNLPVRAVAALKWLAAR
ncbi:MAG: hypothetical protein QM656_07280 [Paracoccaceae bacterium]